MRPLDEISKLLKSPIYTIRFTIVRGGYLFEVGEDYRVAPAGALYETLKMIVSLQTRADGQDASPEDPPQPGKRTAVRQAVWRPVLDELLYTAPDQGLPARDIHAQVEGRVGGTVPYTTLHSFLKRQRDEGNFECTNLSWRLTEKRREILGKMYEEEKE